MYSLSTSPSYSRRESPSLLDADADADANADAAVVAGVAKEASLLEGSSSVSREVLVCICMEDEGRVASSIYSSLLLLLLLLWMLLFGFLFFFFV